MTHIKQRRDTSANWTSANPVLDLGEVGHETNTRRYKLGDGATPWNDLAYSNPAGTISVNGRDGVVTLTAADVDLGAVDNTPDNSKPVSGPQQAALDEKVDAAYVTAAINAATALQRPVGSLYFSVDPVNPGTLFGGTWIAWGAGRVPVGFDSGQTEFDTVEETGGAKTHTHGLSGGHALVSQEQPTDTIITRIKTVASWTATRAFSASGGVVNTVSSAQTGAAELGGNSDAGSTLQPYIVCYIWKRTA